MCECVYVCVSVCVYVCVCECVCTYHIEACVGALALVQHACVGVCVYVCVSVCVYVCVSVYARTTLRRV